MRAWTVAGVAVKTVDGGGRSRGWRLVEQSSGDDTSSYSQQRR
jgi:hypothetical protein